MAIKRNNLMPKTIIKLHKAHFQTGPTKIWKNDRKMQKICNILGLKTPKNDLLTLIYGLPSSFTTLNTWKTTKRG